VIRALDQLGKRTSVLLVVVFIVLGLSAGLVLPIVNHPLAKSIVSYIVLPFDSQVESTFYKNREAFAELRQMLIEDKLHSIGRDTIGTFRLSGEKWVSTTASGAFDLPEVLKMIALSEKRYRKYRALLERSGVSVAINRGVNRTEFVVGETFYGLKEIFYTVDGNPGGYTNWKRLDGPEKLDTETINTGSWYLVYLATRE